MNTIYNTDSNLNDTSNMGSLKGIVPVGAIPLVAVAPPTIHTNSAPHGEKSEKFIGIDFKRWK